MTVRLRSVAIPGEHGGWSLTVEPVLLGLVAASSATGWILGAAALVAFVLRTPVRVVLVDRWRGRRLERTALAGRLAIFELMALAGLLAAAVATAEQEFWWPLAAALPAALIGLWFDARSRSRHLLPELAGSVAIGSAAAAIALAGGLGSRDAAGLWIVIAARVVASVPFVRVQLRRLKGQVHAVWHSDVAQLLGLMLALGGAALGLIPTAAVAAVLGLAIVEILLVRTAPPVTAILGSQQVVLGLAVVLTTGLAFSAP